MKHKNDSSLWDRFRDASVWFFFTGFIVFAVIAVFALRQNNLKAIELRDEVLQADQNKGDVEAKLRELREFVYAHMNADLSSGTGVQQPVQLKYRYERLVEKEKARVEKANEAIYTDAQAYCEKQLPDAFYGGPRVACIEEYVLNNGVKEKERPDELYKFAFVSPRWSPDLAGWSIVLATAFFAATVVKFGLDRWIRSDLQD
jgi:hypothetical protein